MESVERQNSNQPGPGWKEVVMSIHTGGTSVSFAFNEQPADEIDWQIV